MPNAHISLALLPLPLIGREGWHWLLGVWLTHNSEVKGVKEQQERLDCSPVALVAHQPHQDLGKRAVRPSKFLRGTLRRCEQEPWPWQCDTRRMLAANSQVTALGLPCACWMGLWGPGQDQRDPRWAEAEKGVGAAHQECPAEPKRTLGNGWWHMVLCQWIWRLQGLGIWPWPWNLSPRSAPGLWHSQPWDEV